VAALGIVARVPAFERRPILGAGAVEMPDLSGLVGRNMPMRTTYALVDGPEPAHTYLLAFASMIDRAAYAYEQARVKLSEAAGKRRRGGLPLVPLIRGSDYLEIALNALLRAQLLGDRLRRTEDAPPIQQRELLSREETSRIREMRHFAEHVDERISAGSTSATGFAAAPYADGIEYAGVAITYAELAAWITRLQSLAERLLTAPEHP
jgi:hypothetical protein